MVNRKELSKEHIAAIASMSKAGTSNKDIANITGVCLRSVQRLTKISSEAGEGEMPTPKKHPGRPSKITNYSLRVLK